MEEKISPLLISIGLLCTTPVVAEVLAGKVSKYVDGDTFVIGGENIRLKGVDAPEYGQSCKDASGKGYACGKASLTGYRTSHRGKAT